MMNIDHPFLNLLIYRIAFFIWVKNFLENNVQKLFEIFFAKVRVFLSDVMLIIKNDQNHR